MDLTTSYNSTLRTLFCFCFVFFSVFLCFMFPSLHFYLVDISVFHFVVCVCWNILHYQVWVYDMTQFTKKPRTFTQQIWNISLLITPHPCNFGASETFTPFSLTRYRKMFSQIRSDRDTLSLRRLCWAFGWWEFNNPSKIEWDLTNGPLSKLREPIDAQV